MWIKRKSATPNMKRADVVGYLLGAVFFFLLLVLGKSWGLALIFGYGASYCYWGGGVPAPGGEE